MDEKEQTDLKLQKMSEGKLAKILYELEEPEDEERLYEYRRMDKDELISWIMAWYPFPEHVQRMIK